MAVQGTGAMAMIIADVPAVHDAGDPARALFTLSVLTGAVMLAAGILRLGSILRFVSNAVMVGFINAVGVNIVLGQLAEPHRLRRQGANRVVRALDTLLHPGQLDGRTLGVGIATIALIVLLERTPLGSAGAGGRRRRHVCGGPAWLGWDDRAPRRPRRRRRHSRAAPAIAGRPC